MKRLLVTSMLILCLISLNISAESLFFPSDREANSKYGAVVFYNDDGTISSVLKSDIEKDDNGYIVRDIDLSNITQNYKLYFSDGNTILTGEIYKEEIKEEYNNDVYIDDGAALFAPAMVSKVRQIYHDDELKHEVTILYQGLEQVFLFDNTIEILSASDSFTSAIGNNAGYLKPGDAIILNHAFKNDPRSITFVHRPTTTEPVFDNTLTDFKPLYTTSSATRNEVALYSYGVVSEIGDNYLVLQEKDGVERNSKVISFHPDASVYIFDAREKTTPYSYYAAGIFPSNITDDDIDQSGNIITWQPNNNRTYALVRLYDDIATDILVYEY